MEGFNLQKSLCGYIRYRNYDFTSHFLVTTQVFNDIWYCDKKSYCSNTSKIYNSNSISNLGDHLLQYVHICMDIGQSHFIVVDSRIPIPKGRNNWIWKLFLPNFKRFPSRPPPFPLRHNFYKISLLSKINLIDDVFYERPKGILM